MLISDILYEQDQEITQAQLDALETVLDRVFGQLGIDVEFTRHFLDRVNDERNRRQITIKELGLLFKKEFIKHGKPIAQLGPDAEAVMKDMETDINLPFALRWDANNNELDLIAKTVMRKPDFKTSNKTFTVEGYKLQLERDADMMVLHITDTATGKRTEVRGKTGYETNGYDANDKLHQLLDKISKTANISELMNGEPVGINPKHPDGDSAKAAANVAFNESFNNSYKYEWVRKMDASWAAQADTENGALQVQFQMPKPRRWIINFVLNGNYDKTGTGDQFRILATTIAAIRDWFSQQDLNKINSVEFRANKDKDGSSRTKLYARFAKQMANELGWELAVKTKSKEDTFVIQKPKKVKAHADGKKK